MSTIHKLKATFDVGSSAHIIRTSTRADMKIEVVAGEIICIYWAKEPFKAYFYNYNDETLVGTLESIPDEKNELSIDINESLVIWTIEEVANWLDLKKETRLKILKIKGAAPDEDLRMGDFWKTLTRKEQIEINLAYLKY